jgi:DNA-binding GntR family transcriptional regulator
MSDEPRYLQIVNHIRGQIEKSELKVGSVLPSEGILQEQYSVSRHTVREALRRLKEEGLIESRQGAASRVRRASRPVYTYSISSVSELLQYATDAKYEIDKSSVVVAGPELVDKFECEIGSRWLRVEGFRFVENSNSPLCWTEVFVHSEYSGVGVLIGRHRGTIYSAIESLYGVRVEQVEQTLFVGKMPEIAAEGLGVEKDEKSITLRRTYRLADSSIPMVAINYHPVDTFTLSLVLKRSNG